MPVTLKNHDELHESVVRATLAGGAAALATLFLPVQLGPAAMALALGLAIVPPETWSSAALALLWACAAGGATHLGGTAGGIGAALAVGGTLGRGARGATLGMSVTLGTLGALT